MATKSNMNLYSRLKTKIHNIKSDILFLKKCKKFKLIPNFVKIKCAITNQTTERVINASKRMWLNLEIKSHFQKLNSLELELYGLHLTITKDISNACEYDQWLVFGTKLYENISVAIKQKNKNLHEKFLSLLRNNKNRNKFNKPMQVDDFVINLSSELFSEKELELLNYGLKFNTKPVCDPVVDVVVDIETALKFKSESVKHNIRLGAKHTLKDYNTNKKFIHPHIYNEMIEQQDIIKSLQQKDVYYIKADKGNSVVIMDKTDYDGKMLEHITTGNYLTVQRSPLKKMVDNAKAVIDQILDVFRDDEGNIVKKLKYDLKVSNPNVPRLHGFPKIHKKGPLKMRPIVSNINSPNYKIGKWLIKQVKHLRKMDGCSIKNSFEMIEKVKDLILDDDEILVSFDIESLFPSVPVDEALVAMDEWLTDNGIEERKKKAFLSIANLCMTDSYFKFREKFYKLNFGTSMGNPISPLIADLFLSKMEKDLKEKNHLPRWWHRYVDDIVAVIKKSELNKILQMLNSKFPTINFTDVPEEDGQLAFLDLLLIRKNNKIEVAVYHKPTSTKRFIPSTSHCPIQHKMAPFHSMAHRLCKLPLSVANYKKEYDYIQEAAKVNGYEASDIDRIIKHHADKIRKNNISTFFLQQKEENINRVCLTYSPEITNKFKTVFQKQKMQIVYRTQNKLSNFFCSTKDKPKVLEKSGIYQIICPCCFSVYYGQSRRQVQIRYKEHLSSIKNNKSSKSSVAEHALTNLHLNFKPIDKAVEKKEFKLLKVVTNPMRLDAYESFYIHRHTKKKPNIGLMNTDQGNISSYLFNCIK